ncbi:MAG: NAD(P)H-dependent glycerol-3-phosphate dehydrogenase [Candidatus Cryptobacteroides sp.]
MTETQTHTTSDSYRIDSRGGCAVIGYGSWATAIVNLLVRNGQEVWWHIRNEEVLEGLRTEGRNPKYLNDVEFDRSLIHPLRSLDEVVSNAQIVIMATPSAFLKDFLSELTVPLKDKFVISAIKGIIPGDYKTVVEYLHDTYGLSYKQIGIISGPSHAEEAGRGKLSYLSVVCTDGENARVICGKIGSDCLHLSVSQDIYGVEYAAIMKNIYAIAVGMASGLGYGDNFLAVLISRCAKEMTRFLTESYPFGRDTMDFQYLGDLLVTCYSNYSRNRRLGLLIGRGCTVRSALNEMTMIAEGYYASECIRHINFRHKVDMPIADMVYDVLYRNAPVRKRMKELIGTL